MKTVFNINTFFPEILFRVKASFHPTILLNPTHFLRKSFWMSLLGCDRSFFSLSPRAKPFWEDWKKNLFSWNDNETLKCRAQHERSNVSCNEMNCGHFWKLLTKTQEFSFSLLGPVRVAPLNIYFFRSHPQACSCQSHKTFYSLAQQFGKKRSDLIGGKKSYDCFYQRNIRGK